MSRVLLTVCFVCKRRVRVYLPINGDGSTLVIMNHKNPAGEYCYGGREQIEQEDLLTAAEARK